ncbi:MAG: PAS domain S-box protein [Flavobacteriales bacterium]
MPGLPPYFESSKTYFAAVIDKAGNYSYFNQLFIDTFSFIEGFGIGMNFSKTVHPDDLASCTTAALECLSNPDKSVQIRLRKPAPDGKFIVSSWEFSKFSSESMNIEGVLCIGHDISTQLELENQLINNELELVTILNNTKEFFLFLDENYNIKAFNRALKEELKNLLDIEIGMNQNLRNLIDEELYTKFYHWLNEAKNGRTIHKEVKVNTQFNDVLWLNLTFYPVYTQNRLQGMAINGKDINDSKHYELKILEKNEQLKNINFRYSHELRGPLSSMLGIVHQLKEFRSALSEEQRKEYIDKILEAAELTDEVLKSIIETNIELLENKNPLH